MGSRLAIWIWTFNYEKKVVMVNNSTNIKKNDQSPLNREGQQYQQNVVIFELLAAGQ
jgi:hypothetical protein